MHISQELPEHRNSRGRSWCLRSTGQGPVAGSSHKNLWCHQQALLTRKLSHREVLLPKVLTSHRWGSLSGNSLLTASLYHGLHSTGVWSSSEGPCLFNELGLGWAGVPWASCFGEHNDYYWWSTWLHPEWTIIQKWRVHLWEIFCLVWSGWVHF